LADAALGGAFEEESRIVERRLEVLYQQHPELRRTRAEGAGVVVFESEDRVRARGGRIVARVGECKVFREDASVVSTIAPPSSGARAAVVLPRQHERATALLDASTWSAAPRHVALGAGGDYEALGAIALAAAASMLAQHKATEVLVFSATAERGYALRLIAPSP
jgi:hypothetical protein